MTKAWKTLGSSVLLGGLAVLVGVACRQITLHLSTRGPLSEHDQVRLVTSLHSDDRWYDGTPACGDVGERPSVVLLATANHCLSCRNLGFVLRDSRENLLGDIGVLVPAGHAEAVCSVLKAERLATLPVWTVRGGGGGRISRLAEPLVIDRQAGVLRYQAVSPATMGLTQWMPVHGGSAAPERGARGGDGRS